VPKSELAQRPRRARPRVQRVLFGSASESCGLTGGETSGTAQHHDASSALPRSVVIIANRRPRRADPDTTNGSQLARYCRGIARFLRGAPGQRVGRPPSTRRNSPRINPPRPASIVVLEGLASSQKKSGGARRSRLTPLRWRGVNEGGARRPRRLDPVSRGFDLVFIEVHADGGYRRAEKPARPIFCRCHWLRARLQRLVDASMRPITRTGGPGAPM